MPRLYRVVVFVMTLLFLLACSAVATPTQIPSPTAIPPSTTPTFTPTIIATDTAVPTNTTTATPTPEAATISPLLTSVPGIAQTLTAVFSTPGAENTLVAQQTVVAATQGVQLQALSTLLSQCPNPADPPMRNWLDIPVMPQATAGQVVQTLVGPYYCCRAPVTPADVEAFYKEKLPSSWLLQAAANGSMEFVGLSSSGVQLLVIASGPGNKNDLVVAINVTRRIGIPTLKP